MEAKRLLPWGNHTDAQGHPCLRAYTRIGICEVYSDNAWCFYDYDDGDASTQEAAIDACEAAYIKVCTEFLPIYNPATHVVVSREAARRIADTWFVDSPFSSTNDDAALAELRAALEVGG